MIDACKRASARSITAVIPYFGYARADRKTQGRESITGWVGFRVWDIPLGGLPRVTGHAQSFPRLTPPFSSSPLPLTLSSFSSSPLPLTLFPSPPLLLPLSQTDGQHDH